MPVASTRAATSSTAVLKASSFAVRLVLWTSTYSVAGWSKPASSRICWALADWPVRSSASVSCTVPIWLPRRNAITTKASHPNVAVFQ